MRNLLLYSDILMNPSVSHFRIGLRSCLPLNLNQPGRKTGGPTMYHVYLLCQASDKLHSCPNEHPLPQAGSHLTHKQKGSRLASFVLAGRA